MLTNTILRELLALCTALVVAYLGYYYTRDYVITGFLITIADTFAYNLLPAFRKVHQSYQNHGKNTLHGFFYEFWKLLLVDVQTTSVIYVFLMVLLAPQFKIYLLGVVVSFVIANSIYYFRQWYKDNADIQEKLAEWSARYIPAELAAIIGAVVTGSITMSLTGGSAFLSSLAITWVDNILYYGTIIIRDLSVLKVRSLNNISLVFRNILIEFGPAELIQSLIVYPLFLTYIPPLFSSYPVGVIAGMITVNLFFYRLVIPVYEWRKKNL